MTDHGNYTPEVQEENVSGRQPTFTARYLEMPGCVAMGDSHEAAEHALADAREPYIAFLKRHGLEVPKPQTETQVSIWSSTGGFVPQMSSREQKKPARDVSPAVLRPRLA